MKKHSILPTCNPGGPGPRAYIPDGPVPEPIPVTWFARLHNSLAEKDFDGATRARRELRRLGYSIAILPAATGGRR